jgi:hypothetical protein
MSLAEATREAVRERPYLYDALRAGVVNYTAAARALDIDGETDAVATALRRFAEELDGDVEASEASVSMVSGLGRADSGDGLLAVGGDTFAEDAGSLTGIVASGDCSPRALGEVLGRLRVADIPVEAAAGTDGTLAVVVARRDGPDALRVVEGAVGR